MDAAEDSHLNYRGAKKYSRWLGRQLSVLYNLQDCRGTSDAESWEMNLEWENHIYAIFDLLHTDDLKDCAAAWDKLNADVFISFNGNQWKEYKAVFFNTLGLSEERGKMADGLVMSEGKWKIHYCGDTDIIMEEGIDTVSISSSGQGTIINCNGNYFTKVSDGIHVVVYDRYVGDIVDYAAFTGRNALNRIR